MQYHIRPADFRAKVAATSLSVAGAALRPFDHRGLSRAARLIGRMSPSMVTIPIGDHSRFQFSLADPYWSRLLAGGFQHEPGTLYGLQLASPRCFTFVDCGANHGYWSVVASDESMRSKRVIAIEAAPDTFQHLLRNQALNDGRFEVINKAVSARSGEKVFIGFGAGHGSAHIAEPVDDPAITAARTVETIAIDDLDLDGPVVIKLDVEGAEIKALNGAARTIENGALVVYEDHGNDPDCSTTRFVLEVLGMPVLFFDGRRYAHEIRSVDDARRIKRRRGKGYNFFTSRGPTVF